MGNLGALDKRISKLLDSIPMLPQEQEQPLPVHLLSPVDRAAFKEFSESIRDRVDMETTRPLERLTRDELATLKGWVTRLCELEHAEFEAD